MTNPTKNTDTAAKATTHEDLLVQLTETVKMLDEWFPPTAAEPEPPAAKKPKTSTLHAAAAPSLTTPEAARRPTAMAVTPDEAPVEEESFAQVPPKSMTADEAPVEESFVHVPPKSMTGVSTDIVQLCATISGQIYQDKNISTPKEFQSLLDQKIPPGHDAVHVLKFVEPLWDPTITMVRTGSTLIIGWRGTQKFQDVLTDFQIDTCTPWEDRYKYLSVPQAHYVMVVGYFKRWARDLTDMLLGKFRLSDDKTVDITAPIQDIVLTGHSLGGAIAQVAHLYLTLLAPPTNSGSPLFALTAALKNIPLRTVCFSAPMTTALSLPSSDQLDADQKDKTIAFLNKTLAPVMRNIVFSTDVVPRGYADLQFINAFLRAFLRDPTSKGLLSSFVDTFVRFFRLILKSRRGLLEQAEQYFHVAKIIHYENVNSTPMVFVDQGFANQGPMIPSSSEKSFYDLDYQAPTGDVAETAFKIHMKVVTGPGLAFS